MKSESGKSIPAALVVDDDPVCRIFCVHALVAAGYQAFTASDGRNAIQIALRERPRVILTDMHLPDMSGAEAMTRILELWAGAKTDSRFIGMSADDSTPMRSAMRVAGCALTLVKPLQIEALLASIRQVEGQLPERSKPDGKSQCTPGSMHTLRPKLESRIQLQSVFCAELKQQLADLDEVIASLEWTRAAEILHRLCGAAALAGYTNFAACGRGLMRQLHCSRDSSRLAESYLDFIGRATDLLQAQPADAGSGVGFQE